MESNKMLQILLPAAAAAGVVVLVGVLIGMSDWGDNPHRKVKGGKSYLTGDTSGMVDKMPPLDAKEWQPGPNDMKIWDVKEGDGPACPRDDIDVVMHYSGWTTDGKEFDSSRKGSEPITFRLGSLIKGWQEGIPGMKPGGIRRLMIPYEWAYGEGGRPPSIPPKATLIFEVKFFGNP